MDTRKQTQEKVEEARMDMIRKQNEQKRTGQKDRNEEHSGSDASTISSVPSSNKGDGIPKAVDAPTDLKSLFKMLPPRCTDEAKAWRITHIIWRFGDEPGPKLQVKTGTQPQPDLFKSCSLFDKHSSDGVVNDINVHNFLQYVPINIKLSDFWLAMLTEGLNSRFPSEVRMQIFEATIPR